MTISNYCDTDKPHT